MTDSAVTAAPAAPTITFPPELPISARCAEIEAALSAHQVVIVCGETGSGKTTQLPKMALELGRGRMNAAPGEKRRLIGHTQPRRIAASTVAKRIAEELHTPLGAVVGYQVRFTDRMQPGASVKLMTDGILLAETQRDPLLQAYDTLIIDEAHERSLNIDFLLGYLRQILPRRPDLKVIVTSATIDADRFAKHFADARGVPAPVLMVSGRMYPVEQRWRPFEESRDYGLNEAIADAVDELWLGGAYGDILVFLPGEREIRDAANHLRKHLAQTARTQHAEVLPLFSRLPQGEQERIFAPHGAPRIVLATNVAETSLTVPGIRYVIDSGTARVKRYSLRSKVERLLVEPVSQAAANQRAGRCGRVANGICIRLYDEKDFASRPRFTDPEILRSSLAGVILRMQSLHLAGGGRRVEDFPFLEAPSSRAISDGYHLLLELGAVDDAGEVTAVGRELGRLPLDPRVARMILAGRDNGALHEVLVIASALSVPDVRDRPLELQAQADQQHAKFDDEKSEFSGTLKLWHWLEDVRFGHAAKSRQEMAARHPVGIKIKRPRNLAVLPAAQRAAYALAAARAALGQPAETAVAVAGAESGHKLSNRQWEQALRASFINVRRVREWRDVYTQLRTVAAERKWRGNTTPAGYDAIHKAMLTGLLGNIGHKQDAPEGQPRPRGGAEYLGARGIKFRVHPGAHLAKKPAPWVMCAELVETTQLFGRGVAEIDPRWLEEVGGHLLKKQLVEPHWEKRSGAVMALERATLYGLLVYHGRRVRYDPVDRAGAREIFIREALMGEDWPEDWPKALPFLPANQTLIHGIEKMEQKARRQDLLVDDALIYAFYDHQIPADVYDGATLRTWYAAARGASPKLLCLTREELMRHEAAGITTEAFPKLVRLGGVDCRATYLHQPGDAADGLTVTVPLFALNQASAERAEWLVPGMLTEKVQLLLKSLPGKLRRHFVPLPEHAARIAGDLSAPERFGKGALIDALLTVVRDEVGAEVHATDFKLDRMPPYLFMNFRLVGDHGRQLAVGRNLGALKAEWGGQAHGAFQALVALKPGKGGEAAATGNRHGEHAAAPNSPAPGAPQGRSAAAAATAIAPRLLADTRYTAWTFGTLPELLELERKGRSLIGFPALVDAGDAVTIEVFDEPELAAAKHRAGLRRLFALQIKDALKYARKNVPDFSRAAVAYMPLGTADELLEQIIAVALDHAFLVEPLPADADSFAKRLEEGRGRVTLITREVGLLAGEILTQYAAAARKIKETRGFPDVTADAGEQLTRLMGKHFLQDNPWEALHHFPRYLQAIVLRLEKLRANPARDAEAMRDVRAMEARTARAIAQRKGQRDEVLERLRWMNEELRVSLFAQTLRTPQPVSVKRMEKLWARVF